jgi:hypothetical protein
MKIAVRVALMFFALAMTSANGQVAKEPNSVSYGGWVAGIGVERYRFVSNWYWYQSGASAGSREHWPRHILSGLLLTGFVEQQSFRTIGPVAIGARAELLFGVSGGTKEDWKSYDNKSISSGGARMGVGAHVKFALPKRVSSTMTIAPHAAVGLQYTSLKSNGQGTDPELSGSPYYYDQGWTETSLVCPISLGASLEFNEKYVIISEFRFLIAGGAWTDWEPAGYAPSSTSLSHSAFLISVGMKL